MKALITGSSGFIGSSILDWSRDFFDETYILSRKFNQDRDNKITKIKTLNYKDYQLPNDIDYIFHLAGNAEYNNKNFGNDSFELSKYLFDQIEKSEKTACLYFFSTLAAVENHTEDDVIYENTSPKPISEYGKTKLKIEKLLTNYKFKYYILRLPMTFGKNMRKNSHILKFIELYYRYSFLKYINFPGNFSILSINHLNIILKFIIESKLNFKNNIIHLKTCEISLNDIYKTISTKEYPKFKIPYVFTKFFGYKVNSLFRNKLIFSDDIFFEKKFPSYSKDQIFKEIKDLNKLNSLKFNIDKFNDSTTVIIGGSSGLGFEFLKYFKDKRSKVLILDKSKLLVSFENVQFIEIDLNKSSSIQVIEDLIRDNKYISEIIITAGIGYKKSIFNHNQDEISKIIRVNLESKIKILNLFMQKKTKNFSRFIVTSSSSAYIPLPNMGIYAGLNSAINRIFYAFNFENNRDDIDIHIIVPSGMNTNFQNKSGVAKNDEEKLLTTDFVVKKVIHNINRNKFIHKIGLKTHLFDLFSRILPMKLFTKIISYLFDKYR